MPDKFFLCSLKFSNLARVCLSVGYFISNTLGNTVTSVFEDIDLSFCQDNIFVLCL